MTTLNLKDELTKVTVNRAYGNIVVEHLSSQAKDMADQMIPPMQALGEKISGNEALNARLLASKNEDISTTLKAMREGTLTPQQVAEQVPVLKKELSHGILDKLEKLKIEAFDFVEFTENSSGLDEKEKADLAKIPKTVRDLYDDIIKTAPDGAQKEMLIQLNNNKSSLSAEEFVTHIATNHKALSEVANQLEEGVHSELSNLVMLSNKHLAVDEKIAHVETATEDKLSAAIAQSMRNADTPLAQSGTVRKQLAENEQTASRDLLKDFCKKHTVDPDFVDKLPSGTLGPTLDKTVEATKVIIERGIDDGLKEIGFVAKLKEGTTSRWSKNVTAQTGKEVGGIGGKGMVVVGGSVALLGAFDGLKNMKIGLSGKKDPITNEVDGKGFGRFTFGLTEALAAVYVGVQAMAGKISVLR